ncbi:GFA domain-containing protein [Mycena chlorophos]|uniref:GFA domain-containing protein n=1 Tax=Mycena chlorophos TaxID=658473 RepID=A0A8H6VVH5_MYCCL|nr:GFA domain-containing protein [Mycena chlorophos]
MDTSSLPSPWPQGATTLTYTGGCHCKKIQFEFEHPDIYSMTALECNCSICESRGCINVYTPVEKFRFTSGSHDEMTTYTFNSHLVQHRFCPTCGVSIGALVPSYTPQDKFKLTQGSEDEISQYTFASHIVQHRFCPTCGTAIGVLVPSYGYVGINARTVDGIDLERLQKNLTKVNGRELTLSTTEDGGELKPSVSWDNTGRQ